MKTYKHIFLDLDRTLWDFDANSRAALNDIYENHQLGRYFESPETFVNIYHKHNDLLWERYREGKIKKDLLRSLRFELALLDVKIENPELAREIGEDYLSLSTEKTIIFPYTHEILSYLQKKYPLYILTNGFRETQFSKLRNCDLQKYFHTVFTSETIGYNKPHPKIFQWALNSVNARKSESLMIGDDLEVDILGAKSYGIDQVYFNPEKLAHNEDPSFEIQSLIELKDIL
ncbi:MAG: noncanonical pyrimidine nucleotidase, YjjG family [Bacteroidales bacterium]|nr:noncanonical pyrimidine nucleotidase, YjjG family [Bacteroidales bacterium]